ncbi:hypothetical protein [uncultured Alistipes sp.]|jgi:hypothetical protein|uniref:hypothetical protein n=1 Tax=uncultured Alistipes sp. TaxID=538949 RepID=UPI0025FFFBAB|nr:hypothetical protein [uncultured Alistipes sp.]
MNSLSATSRGRGEMSKHSLANESYVKPHIEVLDIVAETGFAESNVVPDYKPGGGMFGDDE